MYIMCVCALCIYKYIYMNIPTTFNARTDIDLKLIWFLVASEIMALEPPKPFHKMNHLSLDHIRN